MRRPILLMVLAGIVAGGILAIKFLPWWALLAGVVAMVPIGKWVLKRALVGLFTAPFKMKGAALKGAAVLVHSLTPTQKPAAEVSAEAESNGAGDRPTRRYFWLDVTVQPAERSEGFQSWEPGELRLVKPESRLNPHDPGADDGDDACEVERLEVEQEGTFQEDEGWKLPGPQRLRLLLAVEPGVSWLKFRYYFEEFGEVRVPAKRAERAA